MNIIKMITENSSIKNMLISKAVEMAKENGFTKVLIDLEQNPVKVESIPKTAVIIEEKTLNFYKEFFEQNKHLLNQL